MCPALCVAAVADAPLCSALFGDVARAFTRAVPWHGAAGLHFMILKISSFDLPVLFSKKARYKLQHTMFFFFERCF